MKRFLTFLEEFSGGDGSTTTGAPAEAPANNSAATPGVDGFTPETLGVRRGNRRPPIIRRDKNEKPT